MTLQVVARKRVFSRRCSGKRKFAVGFAMRALAPKARMHALHIPEQNLSGSVDDENATQFQTGVFFSDKLLLNLYHSRRLFNYE